MITDEIEDIKKYAEFACELKTDYPDIAESIFAISQQEEKHMEMLEDLTTKIMTKYTEKHGEIPKEVMVLSEYMKKCQLRNFEKARLIQQMVKK